jgi:LAS superfamily LD-carboxypeptidase LdcB
MAGKKKRRPAGLDMDFGWLWSEAPDPGRPGALGLGSESGSSFGSLHLIDKLRLESRVKYHSTPIRAATLPVAAPGVDLSDFTGFESFRDSVLAQQIANNRAAGKQLLTNLPNAELMPLSNLTRDAKLRDKKLAKSAAQPALDLVFAARKAIGGPTVSIGIASAFRTVEEDRRLWLNYFTNYYWETLDRRRRFHGGPRGLAAVAFMAHWVAHWKAAPGFSQHSLGIAIDFDYTINGETLPLSHTGENRARWRDTPLYKWLHGTRKEKGHAASFGFKPLSTEPWHWNYLP